ncbi:transglycosylase domain-containing protein [Peptoniphilus sp. KCTC 25270]|uniref:transglycosylase domain-containing protein n=1 Tax=Peptoniphilus sp. KCTC 25270 TaxID=2897414 RepID=UPI001E4266D3|nr:transglycosylase domain-containing protein [Peptoniphilus sp. KCTC 25270]MCD1147202.1 transglycosylase domain-containing protein [Peptoniphilus sp. KCTC 25270]
MKSFSNLTKKHKIQIILLFVMIALFILFASIFAAVIGILKKAPETDFTALKESFAQTSILYDRQGQKIENVASSEMRTLVDLEDIPLHVQEAFLAVEDRQFYDHNGLDVRNIISSILTNVSQGDLVRGGSTISQQLIKNVYLSHEKTFDRKIQEAYLTLRMEEILDKDEILEAYLNRVELGLGAFGVQTASQAYFSKDVKDLTLAEGALLAGIVKSPRNYQPIYRVMKSDADLEDPMILGETMVSGMEMVLVQNPQALERQKVVLHVMEEAGYISAEERAQAENATIAFQPAIQEAPPYSTYVTDYIEDEAARDLAEAKKMPYEEAFEKISTGGYHIYSTLDPSIQRELENLYRNFYSTMVQQSNNEGANFLRFTMDGDDNVLDENGNVLFFSHSNFYDEEMNLVLSKDYFERKDNGDLVLSMKPFQNVNGTLEPRDTYVTNRSGSLFTYDMGPLQLDPSLIKIRETDVIIPKSTLESHPDMISFGEDSLSISSSFLSVPISPSMQPQSSSIIIDNQTGEIVAMTGGLDIDNTNRRLLNRIYSKRQPGTALMPISAYLSGLENKETLGSVYDDVPQMTDGQIWPINPDGRYKGFITLKEALAEQKPSIATTLVKAHGLDASLKTLKEMGIYSGEKEGGDSIITPSENKERNDFTFDSLALGNLVTGVDPRTLTEAYGFIATDGELPKTHMVERIVDAKGNVVLDNRNKKSSLKISKENAFLLRDGLKNTNLAQQIRGNGAQDAMAVSGVNKFNSDYSIYGSTPKYSIGLWIGSDTPKLLLSNGKGEAENFYTRLCSLVDGTGEFNSAPESIIQREISTKTGLLANHAARRNGTSENMYYIKGTEPTAETSNYVRKLICSTSNLLASQYCPYETIVARYYYVRPDGYNPQDFDGIYPEDYGLVPTRYCNIHTASWYQDQMEEDEEDDDNNNEDNNND